MALLAGRNVDGQWSWLCSQGLAYQGSAKVCEKQTSLALRQSLAWAREAGHPARILYVVY
eukprot:symbB.v1.2.042331.t1/scaffold9758.1/size2439/1